MGRKGNWFVALKKAFSPESSEKKALRKSKSKKKWGFGKEKEHETSSSVVESVQPYPLPKEEVKLEEIENEQHKHDYSAVVASSAPTAEVPVAPPVVAAEVVRLKNVRRFPGKSEEEVAAIKIQTAFRGYLARRALRALRGLVRLKTLIDGQSVKRQATNTLRCMQTLARVQSQIRARRIRMADENQALQRQLQLKYDKELENLRASMGEEWDDSAQSKEQIEASLLHKKDAAMRRERALAYAFSHQQMSKNSTRSVNPMFMDPANPQWGWSWLERWMAARPWESRTNEKELNDQSSVRSGTRSTGVIDISKSYVSREAMANRPSPKSQKPNRLSPSTPQSKPISSLMASGKFKSASPKGSLYTQDDDSRSMVSSIQSERPRRHSIAGSSVRDDESLASSPAIPSYMIPTKSARAKLRLISPVAVEKQETPEKSSAGSAKKRLSFPASSGPRRHSGPPRVDTSSIKSIDAQTEQTVT